MSFSNILVTGSTGFIGSHFVKGAKERCESVATVSRRRILTKWLDEILHGTIAARFDLSDSIAPFLLESMITDLSIDSVYHFASQPIISTARKNPLETYRSNIIGTANLLEACRRTDIKRIFYMSTDKVYGEGMKANLQNTFSSTEPYSTSKICAEYIVEDYRRDYGLKIITVRCCNAVGYDPLNLSRIVPGTIVRIMNGEQPIIHDVDSHRQYIYVEDIVKILLKDWNYAGLLNIASPIVAKPREIIENILELMSCDIEPIIKKPDFHEINSQSMDFKPVLDKYTSLRGMLLKTIRHFQQYYRSF